MVSGLPKLSYLLGSVETSVLRPVTKSFGGYKQNDWFAVDIEIAKPLLYQGSAGIAMLPGVRVGDSPNELIVHRTHLPLLTAPEALALLSEVKAGDWAARDRWAADRGFQFRTTQHQSIDFMSLRRGTLLALDMRVGKTAAAVGAHDPARGPLVVVAPLSTRGVWLSWMKRCFPDLPIGVLTGKKKLEKERMQQPIVFCHYDIMKYWQTVMRIGTLVLDEAHLIVNRNADRAKACVLVAARAEKVICATGTPIWDKPPDLWNLIGLLAPAAWGSYWDFGMRYGDPHHNGYGVEFLGATHVEELTERLKEIKIRRLWKDIAKDLPPISRSIIVADLDEATTRKLDILSAKLRKERGKSNTAANLATYRSQLCKSKTSVVVREAKKALDCGEPVVVWTWHREFATELAEKLDGILIHGEIAADERERRLDEWRQSKKALVATMAVAQVGIDLSHAHLALFAELDYTPAVLAQTEMRTFSPARPMHVSFVVANHIVDQRIVRALVSKLSAQDPFGFGSAIDAIDALRATFEGPMDDPDMDRFLDDILASEFEVI